MRLFEFEAKDILRRYGMLVPEGRLARSADEAAAIASEIGRPVVVKAQVLVSGRGKAGGIQFAADPRAAGGAAARLLGSKIKGNLVASVLVEEELAITEPLYASVAVDAPAKSYVVLASASGGVDIEETAAAHPEKVVRRWFDPVAVLADAEGMARQTGVGRDAAAGFARVLQTLCRIALEQDAELVEVNPLALTASGELVAADARITIDDNALFRHPELAGRSSQRMDDTPLEAAARGQNLAYVDLAGDIGIIGNGAGLVMATLDLVALFGGRPANFLDIGGGARSDTVKKALLMVMSKPEVRAVLVNILGGITRCDLVAQGIIDALREAPFAKSVAIRMIGTNEEEGARALREAGVHVYASMEEAASKVIQQQ